MSESMYVHVLLLGIQARALGADAPPLAHALGQIPHVMYETPAFGTPLVSGLLDAVRYERILKGTIT